MQVGQRHACKINLTFPQFWFIYLFRRFCPSTQIQKKSVSMASLCWWGKGGLMFIFFMFKVLVFEIFIFFAHQDGRLCKAKIHPWWLCGREVETPLTGSQLESGVHLAKSCSVKVLAYQSIKVLQYQSIAESKYCSVKVSNYWKYVLHFVEEVIFLPLIKTG